MTRMQKRGSQRQHVGVAGSAMRLSDDYIGLAFWPEQVLLNSIGSPP